MLFYCQTRDYSGFLGEVQEFVKYDTRSYIMEKELIHETDAAKLFSVKDRVILITGTRALILKDLK